MFGPALSNQAPAQSFAMKYFYSLWWGLQNLRYVLSRHFHNYGSNLFQKIIMVPIIVPDGNLFYVFLA